MASARPSSKDPYRQFFLTLWMYWHETDDEKKRLLLRGVILLRRKRLGGAFADTLLERLYVREAHRLGVELQPPTRDSTVAGCAPRDSA
ncbi:MAG: hypothetical protein QM699_05535 [Amaricoccus sp.]|uniref:hypothetical protein n=1 Tax=Amaricoccus sp. TaxID=1872485 RepID=UPI0039E36BF6